MWDWIGRGFEHLIKATGYSLAGLRAAVRHEEAFRQELVALVIAVPLALWLEKTGVARALLIGSCLLVIVVELVNSAIEAVIDRVGPERHELAGRAKDLGSAAVFCAIVLAVVVWVLVLLG
jgi:diacylglycerol kinase (ATP)